MNIKKYVAISLIVYLLCACSSGGSNIKNQETTVIDFDSIEVTHKNYSSLQEVGRLTKAFKLETSRQSLVGTIYRILVDHSNGDLLVGDYDSRKQVLRFDNKGNFVLAYGKPGEGPGEYNNIMGFTVDGDSNLIILTPLKLIKYSKDGTLLIEKKIDFFSTDIEMIGNLIYISIAQYRRVPKVKNTIMIFDAFFNHAGGINGYDSRLKKYNYSSHETIARKDDQLYYSSYYDLSLSVYNPDTESVIRLNVPNSNSSLEQIWNKKSFNEGDRREIRNRIHRFQTVYGFKDAVLLLEVCRAKKIYNIWLLNLEKKEATIFPYFNLIGDFNKKTQDSLFFSLIPGTYENGIIGVFDNVDDFNKYKHQFPLLKDIQFKAEDNPVIAFFEFNN